MDFSSVITYAEQHHALGIYLVPNRPPVIKMGSELNQLKVGVFTEEELISIISTMTTEAQRAALAERFEVKFTFKISEQEYHVELQHSSCGVCVSMRPISKNVRTFQELLIPYTVDKLTKIKGGLVIITGLHGSGKSATLASIIGHINTQQSKYIITIEDPIEYIFTSARSLIIQREVGKHVLSLEEACTSAEEAMPDIIVISELKDQRSIRCAVTAAEMGYAVFCTLCAPSIVQAINMMADAFPTSDRAMVLRRLASSMEGMILQTLLNRQDKAGRVAAYEVLMGIGRIKDLITEDKLSQIPSAMIGRTNQGIVLMSQSVRTLYQRGLIGEDAAKEHLQNVSNAEESINLFELPAFEDNEF